MTRAAWARPTRRVCAACAIGPDYKRPDTVTPPADYRSITAAQTEQSIADVAWADMFGDPELTEVIRQALTGNLDPPRRGARVEEFRARHGVARSAFGPEIRAGVSTSPNPLSDEDATYTGGLTLNWEIDLFGRLRRSDEAARAALLASEDNARAVMSSLVAAVANTWFQLRELDVEIVIISDTIRSQEESLALVRSLMRNGVASGAGGAAGDRAARDDTHAASGSGAAAHADRELPPVPARQSAGRSESQRAAGGRRVPAESPRRTARAAPRAAAGRARAREHAARRDRAGRRRAGDTLSLLSIGLTSFLGIVSPELSHLLDGDDSGGRAVRDRAGGGHADLPVGPGDGDRRGGARRTAAGGARVSVVASCRRCARSPTRSSRRRRCGS